MHQFIDFIVSTVSNWGYIGIFIMMAIESSVIPLPSEVVMIPAGYLVYKGEMQLLWVLASGTFGSIAGAVVNYYFAMFVGRRFIKKYGKYFFIPEEKLESVEKFFHKHGSFSTFSGRLIPVVRHLISIPAGLARMNMPKFIFYTGIGAGIWVTILTALGYFIGQNESLIKQYLKTITIAVLLFLAAGLWVYVKWYNKKNKRI
jgi:membrane protein DedA with SNARE-associated domain